MQPPAWHTRFAAAGLVLPVAALIGIHEERTVIEAAKTKWRRSCNGVALPFRVLYGSVLRTTFRASGPALRWTPNFLELPVDQPFLVYSTKHMASSIPSASGQISVTLPRDVVPGSVVRVWRRDDPTQRLLDVTVAGRVVTLVNPPGPFDCTVQFLPALTCVMIGWAEGAPEIDGTADWSLDVEEQQPS